MEYEYNGNLKERDRIKKVASEILTKYKSMSIDKAIEVAMLEKPISEEKSLDIEFSRLYNIMLIEENNKVFMNTIYGDLAALLKKYSNSKKIDYYYNITYEIYKYLKGEREFPFMEEFDQ